MRRFELLVFDWDGTLSDSTGAIVACLQQACADLDLPVPDEDKARHVIGLGLEDALAFIAPGLARADYGKLAERYRLRFITQTTGLYPGTEALLGQLIARGHRLAIATGKSSRGLQRSLSELGIARYFSAWRCADQCAPKPAPDMLTELMDEFGVNAGNMLMIGDTTHDLQMAASADVVAVAICHGAHRRETLEAMRPMACVANTGELSRWLQQNA
jgi:phosphoglycolate phosphatase